MENDRSRLFESFLKQGTRWIITGYRELSLGESRNTSQRFNDSFDLSSRFSTWRRGSDMLLTPRDIIGSLSLNKKGEKNSVRRLLYM